MLYRSFELDRKLLDEAKREVQLSFSSEQPVTRWYYDIGQAEEILLHGNNNVNLSRLRSVGALIYGHRPDQMANIIGPIRSVSISEDRRGHAVAGIDKDETGEMALTKIKSGSLRGVSFGYSIDKARILKTEERWIDPSTQVEYTGPKVIGTKWTPYEISLTPIPADATVGVGREVRSFDGIEIEQDEQDQAQRQTQQGESDMTEEQIRKMIADAIAAAAPEITRQIRAAIVEDAKPKLRIETDKLRDLLGRAGAISVELKAKVADMSLDGKTESEIMTAMLDATKPAGAQDGGAGPGAEGTGRDVVTPNRSTQPAPVTSFKQITDDDFLRALGAPSLMRLQ